MSQYNPHTFQKKEFNTGAGLVGGLLGGLGLGIIAGLAVDSDDCAYCERDRYASIHSQDEILKFKRKK